MAHIMGPLMLVPTSMLVSLPLSCGHRGEGWIECPILLQLWVMLLDILQVMDILLEVFGSISDNPTLINQHLCTYDLVMTMSTSSITSSSYHLISTYLVTVNPPKIIRVIVTSTSIQVSSSIISHILTILTSSSPILMSPPHLVPQLHPYPFALLQISLRAY